MATTKITSPDLFDLGSLNTALQLPNGTTAERPASPSTGEWRYNTTTNLIEFWDGGAWRDLQSEDIPPVASENFNTVLYDGNGGTNNITGVGFQPDLVWIKQRDTAVENHNWYDSSRGIRNFIVSNSTAANVLGSVNRLNAFDSDGFTVGSDNEINDTGSKYVAWCWKANAGTTVSNGDGNITSTVQVNQAAGFSIVQYTGTGSNVQVGHGLGTAPTMVIFKNVSDAVNWYVWTTATGSLIRIEGLNTTSQAVTSGLSTTLGASTIDFTNTGDYSASGKDYIMYCFADKSQYSKVGTYTGNGSTAGPIINTGFEPAWLMIKVISGGTDSWFIVDNKRQTSNPRDERLFANSTAVEASEAGAKIDFFSNGFQSVGTGGGSGSGQVNGNGYEYIYMAFASDASSAPVLADSFNSNTYDGSDTIRSIAGLGFSPNLVWIKRSDGTEDHAWFDTLRGPEQMISSNLTAADYTTTNAVSSFDADGWTTAGNGATNDLGNTYVSYNWKATSSPAINTDGTESSSVAANQAAGFSIIKFTTPSSPSGSTTVGHGLGTTPDAIFLKRTDGVEDWYVYHTAMGLNKGMNINSTSSPGTYTNLFSIVNDTVFCPSWTLSGNQNAIAYAFKSIAGYSHFGSYVGDGLTGQAVTTGFAPNFVLIKSTVGADNWRLYDTARGITAGGYLEPNNQDGNNTSNAPGMTITSTGWEITAGGVAIGDNVAGNEYIYFAFKENPAQPAVASGEMEYLVVAGGASGGSNGGGGGAGGLRTSYGNTSGGGASAETAITLAAGTYTITVGAGGASIDNATNYQDPGNAGSASTIAGGATVNTVGGGGGGSNNIAPSTGGSGGGSGSGTGGPTAAAGTANEGFAGGDGMAATHPYLGGGGGGAGSVGVAVDGSGPYPGGGGAGLMVAIDATSTAYAGGGGGTGGTGSGYTGGGGAAGSGGGGQGGPYNGSGTAGSTNTGGGGGATGDAGSYTSGSGGSGVIILRMNTSDYSGSVTGSPTVTTSGSETILTYTGSGTYVHS